MKNIGRNVFLNEDNGTIYFVSPEDKPIGMIEINGDSKDCTEEYFVMKKYSFDELTRIANRAKIELEIPIK